jgi:hypothetical protein
MDDAEIVDRVAGRVILLDPDGKVLLFHGFDPRRPDEPWWFTPGGGLQLCGVLGQRQAATSSGSSEWRGGDSERA